MIRRAKTNEAKILTELTFASKGYWCYPKEFFDIWQDELTITSVDIVNNDVHVFENDSVILGYYSLTHLLEDMVLSSITIPRGYWLEHMFVDPGYIGRGIGELLFRHLKKRCLSKGIRRLNILADPNARGFYEKMGCEYQSEYPSTIANRTTPYFVLML